MSESLTMKRITRLFIPLFICLVVSPVLQAESLRIGRAAVKITPPVGTPMGSSYGINVSEGVRDDLFAKAVVVEQNGTRAALVACDLISIREAIITETRKLIRSQTSLSPDQVIIAATHCHAGPQMHPLFLKQVGGKAEQMGLDYVQKLPSLIVEALKQAEADLQPAQLSAAVTCEESLVFNRRFLMKDGTVDMNPGRMNPDARRPVGEEDCAVSVIYFESPDFEPLATLVNYPLHVAISGGDHFSSDYPGVLSRALARVKGDQMVTIFTNGTSGNINHIDVSRKRQLRGAAESARIGTILAGAVLKAYSKLQPIESVPLGAGTRKVDLPVETVSQAEVQKAFEVMSRYGKENAPPFHDVVRAWRTIDLSKLDGKPLQTEVQAITFGTDLALVGFPGDAFVEMGLGIKMHSPFPVTVVSEQSGSGSISYVPNIRAFPEGGYEVISARFKPGGGEQLIDAAVRLLVDLFPYR